MAKAQELYNALNGFFCLYKPAGKSVKLISKALQMNLAREMNKLPCRPINTKLEIQEGIIPTVSSVPDLADHPLVVGPRYVDEDFKISSFNDLDTFSSGVSIFGIGDVSHLTTFFFKAKQVNVYHVDGEFGKVTWDHKPTGRIAEQTTYSHIRSSTIDRIIAGLQANHSRHMYHASNLDLQTKEAYDLAVLGPLRPSKEMRDIVIYAMKMIYFKPPHFSIEIHSVNETGSYFSNLIHNIGLEAHSSAFCTKIRRVRMGYFGLESALLPKFASDPKLLVENIDMCKSLVEPENLLHYRTLGSHDYKLLLPPTEME